MGRGHNEKDVIYRYSLDKITAYWNACQANDQNHLKMWTSAMRGNPKEVNEFFKGIDRRDHSSVPDASGGKANRQDVRRLQGLLGGGK